MIVVGGDAGSGSDVACAAFMCKPFVDEPLLDELQPSGRPSDPPGGSFEFGAFG